MKSPALLGDFDHVKPENRITTVIINGHEKGIGSFTSKMMVFYPKEDTLKELGIPVRRTIEFVSGPSEVEGQGTDGLQYYVGKTFWDTNVLKFELERRSTVQ